MAGEQLLLLFSTCFRMKKKSLLAIFPQLPLPEFAGDRQKVNNLIKIFNKHFNLHVVIISRQKPTTADNEFLELHSQSYIVLHLTKLKIFINLIRGIFTSQPLQVSFFYNTFFQTIINKKAKNVDEIFCNLIRVAKYGEHFPRKKYIDIVDSLSINYKRLSENVPSVFWKFLYTLEYKRLALYEEKVIEKFKTSYLVNHTEYEYWNSKIPTATIVWLPQGIKQHLFEYTKTDVKYSNSILFIGKMDYQPNEDAVVWFLKNVWHLVTADIHFYIVGVNPSKKVKKMAASFANITVAGYVEDPYLIMNSCIAVVSPMQTGGGVQNKILEAMALGKINIATSRGAESIRYGVNNIHFIVEDDANHFVQKIEDVYAKPELFAHISKNASDLAKNVFTWHNFEQQLINNLN
jgi:glycosyltransferase involved in cell wall biosynthesis